MSEVKQEPKISTLKHFSPWLDKASKSKIITRGCIHTITRIMKTILSDNEAKIAHETLFKNQCSNPDIDGSDIKSSCWNESPKIASADELYMLIEAVIPGSSKQVIPDHYAVLSEMPATKRTPSPDVYISYNYTMSIFYSSDESSHSSDGEYDEDLIDGSEGDANSDEDIQQPFQAHDPIASEQKLSDSNHNVNVEIIPEETKESTVARQNATDLMDDKKLDDDMRFDADDISFDKLKPMRTFQSGKSAIFLDHRDGIDDAKAYKPNSFIRYCIWQRWNSTRTGKEFRLGYIEFTKNTTLAYAQFALGSTKIAFIHISANIHRTVRKAICTNPDMRVSGPWEIGDDSASRPGPRKMH